MRIVLIVWYKKLYSSLTSFVPLFCIIRVVLGIVIWRYRRNIFSIILSKLSEDKKEINSQVQCCAIVVITRAWSGSIGESPG